MMAKKNKEFNGNKEFHMTAIVAIVAIVGLVLMFTNFSDITGNSVRWLKSQEDRQGVFLPGTLPLYGVKYSSDEVSEPVEEMPMYVRYDGGGEWGEGNVRNRGVILPGNIPLGQSQYTTIMNRPSPYDTGINWESREPCYSPRLSLRNCRSGDELRECAAYEEMLLNCLIDNGIATECQKACVSKDVVWGRYDEVSLECFRECGYSL